MRNVALLELNSKFVFSLINYSV